MLILRPEWSRLQPSHIHWVGADSAFAMLVVVPRLFVTHLPSLPSLSFAGFGITKDALVIPFEEVDQLVEHDIGQVIFMAFALIIGAVLIVMYV